MEPEYTMESLEVLTFEQKTRATNKYMAMDPMGKVKFWEARKTQLLKALATLMETINHYPMETSSLLLARGHILAELDKVEARLQGAKEHITPTKKKENKEKK